MQNRGHGLCKRCYKRDWRVKNPERSKAYYRGYYRRNKKKEIDRSLIYYEEHREESLAKNREWHKNNRDRVNDRRRKWYRDNRAKRIERVMRRRALKYSTATEPLVDFIAQLVQKGEMCIYCGSTTKPLEVDHIIALSKGGLHIKDNLVAACRNCNASKHAKPLEEWLQDQPYSIAWVL